MDRMVAYCGLVCTECPAYIATQAGDHLLLMRTAVEWSRMYGVSISPESIMCDGCLAESDRLCAHCYECDIRACARERGVANCAWCASYVCNRLQAFLGQSPEAGEALEHIRAGL